MGFHDVRRFTSVIYCLNNYKINTKFYLNLIHASKKHQSKLCRDGTSRKLPLRVRRAHHQKINTTQFKCSSRILCEGGVIKLTGHNKLIKSPPRKMTIFSSFLVSILNTLPFFNNGSNTICKAGNTFILGFVTYLISNYGFIPIFVFNSFSWLG